MVQIRILKLLTIFLFTAVLVFGQRVDWVTQLNRPPVMDARKYQFTRTNGLGASGDLSEAGTGRTVTLTPCPDGIAGANSNHYVYISGGTGTAEFVLITGGTCTPLAAVGTITMDTSNTHTGAWSVTSATAGIQEAIHAATSGTSFTVLVPESGTLTIYAPVAHSNRYPMVDIYSKAITGVSNLVNVPYTYRTDSGTPSPRNLFLVNQNTSITGNLSATGTGLIGNGLTVTGAISSTGSVTAGNALAVTTGNVTVSAGLVNVTAGSDAVDALTVKGQAGGNYFILRPEAEVDKGYLGYWDMSSASWGALTIPATALNTTGTLTVSGTVTAASASDHRINNSLLSIYGLGVNVYATGNRYALVDLLGDDTYTSYGTRLLRGNTGANADTTLTHRGTGNLNVQTEEAGDILLRTTNTTRAIVTDAGYVGIGTTSPGTSTLVLKAPLVTDVTQLELAVPPGKTSGWISRISLADYTATGWANLNLVTGAGSAQIGTSRGGGASAIPLTIVTDDVARITIKATGEVGVNETNPATTLHVKGVTTFANDGTAASEIRIREDSDNGTEYVSWKAPAAITASRTLVLPAVYGTANQGLCDTDGAGTLGWCTYSTGMSDPMTTAGDIIRRNGSNVTDRLAIGTSGQCLVVTTGLPEWGSCASGSTAGSDTQVQYNASGAFGANADFTWDNTNKKLSAIGSIAGTKTSLQLTNSNSGTSSINRLAMGNDMSASAFLLDVYSSTHTTYPDDVILGAQRAAGDLLLQAGGSTRITIGNAGAVGIGTTPGAYELTVSSSVHVGDVYDSGVYGQLQITRPADQANFRYHLGFVRSGTKVAGIGFLDNSSVFGIQTTNDNTGSKGIFIDDAYIGINQRAPGTNTLALHGPTASDVTQLSLEVPTGKTSGTISRITMADYTGTGATMLDLLTETGSAWIGTKESGGATSIPLRFGTASTTRMWLETDGDVGIGAAPASGYRLDVSGGVTRAQIQDKAGQVYNVKAYGAVGDGSTDDTTAMQAAITAAQTAGGGTVFFPPGSYKTTGLTVSAANIRLHSSGAANAKLVPSAASNVLVLVEATAGSSVRFEIDGLGFDNSAKLANVTAVKVRGNRDFKLHNLIVTHAKIHLLADNEQIFGFSIRNVDMFEASQIHIDATSPYYAFDGTIDDIFYRGAWGVSCASMSFPDALIKASRIVSVTMSNIKAADLCNNTKGIEISGASEGNYINHVTFSRSSTGIDLLTGVQWTTISACDMDNSYVYGINLNANFTRINHTTINGPSGGKIGIRIAGGTGNIIQGNTFTNFTDLQAIKIESGVIDFQILDNYFSNVTGTATDIYIPSGTSSYLVSGNLHNGVATDLYNAGTGIAVSTDANKRFRVTSGEPATSIAKPAGTWSGLFESFVNATANHGLASVIQYANDNATALEAGVYWNGTNYIYTPLFTVRGSGNIGFNSSSFGTGNKVLAIGNAVTVPSTDPTGGGILYVEGGALKYRGSSGTVTTIANP